MVLMADFSKLIRLTFLNLWNTVIWNVILHHGLYGYHHPWPIHTTCQPQHPPQVTAEVSVDETKGPFGWAKPLSLRTTVLDECLKLRNWISLFLLLALLVDDKTRICWLISTNGLRIVIKVLKSQVNSPVLY